MELYLSPQVNILIGNHRYSNKGEILFCETWSQTLPISVQCPSSQRKLCNTVQTRFDKIMAHPSSYFSYHFSSASQVLSMRVSRGAPVCTVWKPGPWGIMERQIKVSAAWRLLQAGGNCSHPLSPGLAMPTGRLSSKQLGDAWWWWSLPARMQRHLYTSLEDKPAQRNPISQCEVLRHCSWALDPSPFLLSPEEQRERLPWHSLLQKRPCNLCQGQQASRSRTSFPQAGVSAVPLQAQARHCASQNNHLKMLLLQLEVPLASPTRVILFCPNSAKLLHSGAVSPQPPPCCHQPALKSSRSAGQDLTCCLVILPAEDVQWHKLIIWLRAAPIGVTMWKS